MPVTVPYSHAQVVCFSNRGVTSCHQLSPTVTNHYHSVTSCSQCFSTADNVIPMSPRVTKCHLLSPTVTPYCHHLPLTLTKGYHLCQYLLTLSQPELIIKDLLFQIYTLIFLPFTFLKSFWWQYGDKGGFMVTGRALELENGLPQILTYLSLN